MNGVSGVCSKNRETDWVPDMPGVGVVSRPIKLSSTRRNRCHDSGDPEYFRIQLLQNTIFQQRELLESAVQLSLDSLSTAGTDLINTNPKSKWTRSLKLDKLSIKFKLESLMTTAFSHRASVSMVQRNSVVKMIWGSATDRWSRS